MKKLHLFCSCLLLSGCMQAAMLGVVASDAQQNVELSKTRIALIKANTGLGIEEYWETVRTTGTVPVAGEYHAKVKAVVKNTQAEKDGIRAGDEIINIKGDSIYRDAIFDAFFSGSDKPFPITFKRGNKEFTATFEPI